MCEARPGLGLELVAREVLRPEGDRLAEVALEVGGLLARDPVDEVERDVVKSGITEMVEGPADGIGSGESLEGGEELRLEALRAE
jgi:hypothetical protein